MAIRFRRRIKLLPGFYLNVGKTGVSTSVGVRGASVTLGKTARVNVGLPGTGLSVSQVIGSTATDAGSPVPQSRRSAWHAAFEALLTFIILVVILQLVVVMPLMAFVTDSLVFGATMAVWGIVSPVIALLAALRTYRRVRGPAPAGPQ